MLVPYVRPQDTITQNLQNTAAREESRRNPIVIGPQFNLYLNDGRDLDAAKLDFATAGASALPYQDELGATLNLLLETPVPAEAELYGEDLEALVATFGSGDVDVDTSDTTWRSIRVDDDLVAGVGTLNTALDGRQVRVGDVIEAAWSGDGDVGTSRRQVIGLLGELTTAKAAADLTKTAAATNAITAGADAAFLIDAATTAGYTVPTWVDLGTTEFLRNAGKVYADSGGDLRLGDELTVVITTGGDNSTAVADVTSQASGSTESIACTGSGGATEFDFPLAALGYTGGSALVVVHTGDVVLGDVITVRLFPDYTVPDLAADLTIAGSYAGTSDLRYVIEVIALDPTPGNNGTVRIYDTTGVEPVSTDSDPASGSVPLGTRGLTFTLDDSLAYYVGQKFYVDAEAAAVDPDSFDGLKLDGPVVPSAIMLADLATILTSVTVYQRYTGPLDSDNVAVGEALDADATEWAYAAALGLNETDTGLDTAGLSLFKDAVGQVFLSYKSIVTPAATESVIELDSTSEILSTLGETKQENWLARGALESFRGNQNQVVYALRTAGDTVDDFTTALNKIRTTDQVYALAPMTDLAAVKDLVADHCTTQSNKYNKNFRRCYVGTDSPGEFVNWGELTGGGYRTAQLDSSVVTLESDYRADSQFSADDVGAQILIHSLGLSFEITEVLSAFEVLTDAGAGVTTADAASGITVTYPDTPEATAVYVRNQSKALANRRAVNVWSHYPTTTDEDGNTEILQNKFMAAEVAGLRCALLPQQGLTLTEIASADAAPGMYATFSPELLDDIAADGTMVVTQESEGGDIFIRHQLTTKVESDAALEYEDNVGVIVDEFAFAVKDTFRKYIGRRNATPDTIAEIDDELKAIAADFTEAELVNAEIGPMVLAFYDENGNEGEVTVRQDGDLADTLLTYVKLRVPLPINGINHYIDVEVTETLAGADG